MILDLIQKIIIFLNLIPIKIIFIIKMNKDEIYQLFDNIIREKKKNRSNSDKDNKDKESESLIK